jgi:6-phosphofructokinase 1
MNVIVGQSGGPTAVINATLAGVYEGAKKANAATVYGMKNGIEGVLSDNLIRLEDYLDSPEKVELLKRTPASWLGSCRYKLKSAEQNPADYERIFSVLKARKIDYFFYIGGNDSMDTIAKLSAYGKKIGSDIRFVGIPKTIDNDLMATDHSPGYGSAAKFVATAVKEMIKDAMVYDMKSLLIVEIMGRNAGWLTASSALAKGDDCDGVDMIFLPEMCFDLDKFVQRIAEKQKTKGNLVVAVSESLKVADGRYVCELADSAQETDLFGHKRLTGTARFLAEYCNEKLGIKTRAVELSTLQRCASHISSLTDVSEAFEAGVYAVNAAKAGKTGVAVSLKRTSNAPYVCEMDLVEVDRLANHEKTIPAAWIDEENACMKEEFLAYVKPLIQGELTPVYKDGLPSHLPPL